MARFRMVALCAVGLCVAVGCRGRSAGTPADPPEPDRFPHELHRVGLTCRDCHALPSVLAGVPAQPGADDHSPCDRGECHQTEFVTAPGPLCRVCHDSVDPTGARGSPLSPYPRPSGRRALASAFSHTGHLDTTAIEKAVGFHVSCVDCHPTTNVDARASEPAPAGHRECARCHAPEAALRRAPAMDDCEGCHTATSEQPSRQRRLIRDDLRFDHRTHEVDRSGARIPCLECHAGSPAAGATGAHPLPQTAACVACHDDPDRVPTTMRMASCGTCHGSGTRTFAGLPPRSHLPAAERPEDHTLAFRRDHADEARDAGARCARCHSQMSGSPRDTCDECHQSMRPVDHMVTFREFDHGSEAAADPSRCATCHNGSFCIGCHSQTPRSHRPATTFRETHGALAEERPRTCATCHDPLAFCGQCHQVSGQ